MAPAGDAGPVDAAWTGGGAGWAPVAPGGAGDPLGDRPDGAGLPTAGAGAGSGGRRHLASVGPGNKNNILFNGLRFLAS